MRRGLALALLIVLSLCACATKDRVDLPQLEELRRELLDSSQRT